MYPKSAKYRATAKRAKQAAACSRFMNVLNGAGGCAFGAQIGVDRFPIFEWLNAATGWTKTPAQYMEIGTRIQTLKQAFNCKHGIDPKSARPNPRTVGQPPMTEGANQYRTVNIDQMTADYWQEFHWDAETGKPAGEMADYS
jgi:aldehyde:ferredoxin oxidoreductase